MTFSLLKIVITYFRMIINGWAPQSNYEKWDYKFHCHQTSILLHREYCFVWDKCSVYIVAKNDVFVNKKYGVYMFFKYMLQINNCNYYRLWADYVGVEFSWYKTEMLFGFETLRWNAYKDNWSKYVDSNYIRLKQYSVDAVIRWYFIFS